MNPDAALRGAIKAAIDAGDFERATALLEMLRGGAPSAASSDVERARRWLRDHDGAETVVHLAQLLADVRDEERAAPRRGADGGRGAPMASVIDLASRRAKR